MKPTIEALRNYLCSIGSSTDEPAINILDDALTELGELRSKEIPPVVDLISHQIKDLKGDEKKSKANELITALGNIMSTIKLQAKLERAKEGFKTIESVDRSYVDAHGYEGVINNMIGLAQQNLKAIEEE